MSDTTSSVTPEFKEASTRAAIRALRGLEQTAVMLETWAPEIFPDVNEQGQKDFGRIMMESAAKAIRDAWTSAIVEVENFPIDPASIIEQRGALRQSLLDVAVSLSEARTREPPSSQAMPYIREALEIAKDGLKSSLATKVLLAGGNHEPDQT